MKKKMVLLIDEKKKVFEDLQLFLPKEVFIWDQTIEKGFNTLNLLKELIGLVILDHEIFCQIPDTSGIPVLARFKSSFPKIPVVVLGQGTHLENKVISNGVLAFLEKPINMDYLENIIEGLN